MRTEAKWKFFFRFSAVFNFSAALSLLLAPELFFKLLGMHSIYTSEIIPWVHQFGVLVLTFGIGYWVISLDPEKHRDIIWLGCLGKLMVFLMAWIDALSGHPALIPFAILVIADFLFALFYWRYLSQARTGRSDSSEVLT